MGQLRLKRQLCRLQAVTQGKTLNVCESGPPHCDMVMGNTRRRLWQCLGHSQGS